MSEVKAYLHVVYAAFGDASILEFHSGESHNAQFVKVLFKTWLSYAAGIILQFI